MSGRGAFRRVCVVLAGLVAGIVGCASTGGGTENSVEVSVRVVNHFGAPTMATLWIADDDDATRLGRVPPDTTVAFTFRPRGELGDYRLIVEDRAGTTTTSRPFAVTRDLLVIWELGPDWLEVRRLDAEPE